MIKIKIHHSTNHLTLSNSNVTTNDVNALNSQDYVISGLYYWPGPLYMHVRQHYGLSFKSDRPNHVILTPRGCYITLSLQTWTIFNLGTPALVDVALTDVDVIILLT